MKRMLIRASGLMVLVAGLFCGAAASAADPGRPKIVNNSLRTADGQMMRGDTLYLTCSKHRGDQFTLTPHAWSENTQLGFNIRRVMSVSDPAPLAKIDEFVNLAVQAGQYVILAYTPLSRAFGSKHHKEFWSTVAPRYKDRTHVMYELSNEPPDAWPVSADETSTFTGGIPMAKMVRDLAPDTTIVLFSNDQTPRAPSYYQKFEDG